MVSDKKEKEKPVLFGWQGELKHGSRKMDASNKTG
jgi:hypothetical protein